ncbi:hypothetical protein KAFR_0D04180 [Kazachstania africana CBS 2517]|uniref:Large ribosomal subunit protein mL43 n=1 Tax=Kazachstania africana (strain ATCC 22294 / BCRC 22015 / CBS 2517 / CECT 1963 / NBRC 1671 / NRRL Y-8276) TaxID=1071382 RepID=H2AUL6_KAZAF|nr:hypothetical protein KAFR_0D04180 [Kazachstania africana CBS 2517]CCF58066.1 hypothetical protein KAFR_0D04180 [Kazachstania africana CBS 2517]
MVVKAISRVSLPVNGVSTFVLPCCKITLQYCNWGGSSQGMRHFLKSSRLDKLATKYPSIEFNIIKKSGHPLVRAKYTNGREKVVCVGNMNIDNVENKILLLKDSSGEQLMKLSKNDNVRSLNGSVRGVWSPFHSAFKHKV